MRGSILPDEEYNRRWIERVRARCIVDANGCWVWQGSTQVSKNQRPDQVGYATTNYRHKTIRAHRKMLELTSGQTLPKHLHACHTCDNRPCCNPDHLYPGTNQQNHLDGGKRKRMQGQTKTHCKSGHEFTPENTYWGKRGLSFCRQCKQCARASGRRRYWRDPTIYNKRRRENERKRKQQRVSA